MTMNGLEIPPGRKALQAAFTFDLSLAGDHP